MSEADRSFNALHRVLQILRAEELSAGNRVQELYSYLFENRDFPNRQLLIGPSSDWDILDVRRLYDLIEEIVPQYTARFFDPRVMNVTYYKRERRVRRHLDQQFSTLFKELMNRAGSPTEPELVTEEPIYYLTQQAREKRFPRSKDGHPSLPVLRTRLHLALSKCIETGPDFRKVLLPHEIR